MGASVGKTVGSRVGIVGKTVGIVGKTVGLCVGIVGKTVGSCVDARTLAIIDRHSMASADPDLCTITRAAALLLRDERFR